MSENPFEDKFTRRLFEKFESNPNYLLPKTKYQEIIHQLQISTGVVRKTARQYKLHARYEILQCGYTDKLIKKRKSPTELPVYFITLEETHDVIKTAHLATGHGGRDRMIKELEKKFANVHRESVELFKSFCKVCQDKPKKQKGKEAAVRINLPNEFSSRAQVDFIDFQSMCDDQYRWIMVHQDHFYKICDIETTDINRSR